MRRPIVCDGVLLRRTIVPDNHRVRRPAEAHLIFGHLEPIEQIPQQFCAFDLVHPIDPTGEARIDEQDLLARLGMHADDRMVLWRKLFGDRRSALGGDPVAEIEQQVMRRSPPCDP